MALSLLNEINTKCNISTSETRSCWRLAMHFRIRIWFLFFLKYLKHFLRSFWLTIGVKRHKQRHIIYIFTVLAYFLNSMRQLRPSIPLVWCPSTIFKIFNQRYRTIPAYLSPIWEAIILARFGFLRKINKSYSSFVQVFNHVTISSLGWGLDANIPKIWRDNI